MINKTSCPNFAFQMAARVLSGSEVGELRLRLNSATLGSIVAPVTEYIIKAGQSQLATQCEHTEGLFILLYIYIL